MTSGPTLTDRAALDLHRVRARRVDARGLFLHEIVADEVEERLAEVNRAFTEVAVVTGAPDFWSQRWPEARITPDTSTLDLSPETHDLILHVLALHWSDDPVGQLIQCRRALRPDGMLMAVCLGGQTLSELRAALAEAEIAVSGGLSPRIAPMAEIRDLGALLQRAGFALPVADALTIPATYPSAFDLMADLRAMGETNALAARDRRIPPRALFPEAARRYAEAFGTPDGRIRATFDLVWMTGWAPHGNQQKPLRPGSASARLADALGVPESPAGDTIRRPQD